MIDFAKGVDRGAGCGECTFCLWSGCNTQPEIWYEGWAEMKRTVFKHEADCAHNTHPTADKSQSITRVFLELDFRDKIEVEREMAFRRAGGEPMSPCSRKCRRLEFSRAARCSLESRGWEVIQQSRCQTRGTIPKEGVVTTVKSWRSRSPLPPPININCCLAVFACGGKIFVTRRFNGAPALALVIK